MAKKCHSPSSDNTRNDLEFRYLSELKFIFESIVGYKSGDQRLAFYEKKLKSKISCKCLFNCTLLFYSLSHCAVLPSCYPAILSSCHTAIQRFIHIVFLPSSHPPVLLHCYPAFIILPSHHLALHHHGFLVSLLAWHTVIFKSFNAFILPSFVSAIPLSWNPSILPCCYWTVLPSCSPVILSSWYIAVLLSCHPVMSLYWHLLPVILLFCCHAILPSYYTTIQPPCHPIILSFSYPALPSCYLAMHLKVPKGEIFDRVFLHKSSLTRLQNTDL
jgi:hypothetical protein